MNVVRWGGVVHVESLLLAEALHLSLDLSYMEMSPCLGGRQCGATVMGWALEKVLVLKLDCSA